MGRGGGESADCGAAEFCKGRHINTNIALNQKSQKSYIIKETHRISPLNKFHKLDAWALGVSLNRHSSGSLQSDVHVSEGENPTIWNTGSSFHRPFWICNLQNPVGTLSGEKPDIKQLAAHTRESFHLQDFKPIFS